MDFFMIAQQAVAPSPDNTNILSIVTQGTVGSILVSFGWYVLRQFSEDRRRMLEANDKRDEFVQKYLSEMTAKLVENTSAMNAIINKQDIIVDKMSDLINAISRIDSRIFRERGPKGGQST